LPESLQVVEAMMSFLYKKDYSDQAIRCLEFHAQVYIAAEKYSIIPLKHYAAYGKIGPWLWDLEKMIDSAGSSPHVPALQAKLLEFQELVVLIYTNTHDSGDILRRQIVDYARKVFLTHHTADQDDAWTKCFSDVPAFALDLVKPASKSDVSYRIFHSQGWRQAEDTVIRECNDCDTAAILSKESAKVAWGYDLVEKDSNCPNHDTCGGKLEYEYPTC